MARFALLNCQRLTRVEILLSYACYEHIDLISFAGLLPGCLDLCQSNAYLHKDTLDQDFTTASTRLQN